MSQGVIGSMQFTKRDLKKTKLICPSCKSPLSGTSKCVACGRRFKKVAGIPVLMVGKPNCYGEFGVEDFRRIIREVSRKDWRKVVLGWTKHAPFLRSIIMDETRADFQSVLPLEPGASILDVGLGWGTVSVPLARRFSVIACAILSPKGWLLLKSGQGKKR